MLNIYSKNMFGLNIWQQGINNSSNTKRDSNYNLKKGSLVSSTMPLNYD